MSSEKANLIDAKRFQKLLNEAVSLPLVLVLAMSVVLIGLLANLSSARWWVEHSDQVIRSSAELEITLIEAQSGLRGYLLRNDEGLLVPYHRAQRLYAQRLAYIRKMTTDNPVQLTRIEQIMTLTQQWWKVANTLESRYRNYGDNKQPSSLTSSRSIMRELRDLIREFRNQEYALRLQRTERAANLVWWLSFASIAASVIIGTALALRGRKQLLILSEIYGATLEKQAEQAKVMEDKAWLRSAQTVLAEKTRGEQTLQELGLKVLEFLAEYLGASIGAIYALGEDGTYRQIATYASDNAQVLAQESFAVSERLIGQAAAEGRLVHLDSLPPNYVKISSGLGSAIPREIVILPLNSNQIVHGVVELGTLQSFTPLKLDALQLVSESIGVSIQSAQYRQRLEQLLDETKRQADELHSQQEELEAGNAQLEEQAVILEEQKENLRGQNETLSRTKKSLEAKTDELERSNRYKSEFLANVSHELRTPLNSSLILLRLLLNNENGSLSDDQMEQVQTIYSSNQNLLRLIDDLLDLSKVEAGKLELHIGPAEPAKILEELRHVITPLTQEKNLELHIQLAPDTPQSFISDPYRIAQVLKNFLSNAIKFTERGIVTLRAGSHVAKERKWIAFSVSDTGVGISPEKLSAIFEPFRQLDGTITRKYGGVGLGLSISMDLARLLQGEIDVQSQPQVGTTFTLLLPEKWSDTVIIESDAIALPELRPSAVTHSEDVTLFATRSVPQPVSDDQADVGPEDKILLIIEDDPTFAKVLRDLAHSRGFKTLITHTADDGVKLAQKFIPNGVILDLALPGGSGFSVLTQLKRTGITQHVPVHVISGVNQDRESIDMGAIGFLQKPASPEELKNVFDKLEQRASTLIRQVLVVEDDPIQSADIERLVSNHSVHVKIAKTGKEALQELARNLFDCIIMDLRLTDMHGRELLERMSQHTLQAPPIIIYTAQTLSVQEEEELRRRAVSIVIKGDHAGERLLDEVTIFLHQIEPPNSDSAEQFVKRGTILRDKKILIVDDDIKNLFAVAGVIEKRGALAHVARSGNEALEKLDPEQPFDLILMDVMMPQLDGYQTIRAIRDQTAFSKVPIIAITARTMPNDHAQALEAGANDYMSKPLEPEKLISLIHVWLSGSRGSN